MKTNSLSPKNTSIYYIVGFLSVLLTSCGSYQNSSYYDSDGIYGGSANVTVGRETQNNRYNQNQYKEYFNSLQKDNESAEVFTNIDNYSSYNLDNNSDQNNDRSYPGWGSNPQTVSINYYDTGWAMNNWYGNNWYGNNYYGNGWYGNGYYGNNWYDNNWYGNNFGWNYGYGWGMNIGFGWNNWYGNNWYGNGYYGNNWGHSNYYDNRTRSYNAGRRGGDYTTSGTGINARNSSSYSRTQDNTISRRAVNSDSRQNTDFNRNSTNRTSPTFSRNPQPDNSSRNSNQNNTQPAPRRGNINNGRTESNAPTRSYTPSTRSEDNSRSYTPSSNSSSRSSGGESRSSGGESRSSGSRGGRG